MTSCPVMPRSSSSARAAAITPSISCAGISASAGSLPSTLQVQVGSLKAGGLPVTRYTVSSVPPGLAGEALDRHTQGWADRLNRSGLTYLTPAVLDGRWMVRVSIGAEATEREHVQQVWQAMRDEVAIAR